MAHGGGSSIGEIYKGVINDVILQVKEAFLDENVDIDVLQQLKKEWEERVVASGCVDWDGGASTSRAPQQVLRAVKPQTSQVPPTVRLQHTTQHQVHSQMNANVMTMQAGGGHPVVRPHPQQLQYLPSTVAMPFVQNLHTIQGSGLSHGAAAAQAVLPTGAIAFASAQGTPSRMSTHYMIQGSGMPPGIMLVPAPGQAVTFASVRGAVKAETSGQPVQQLDGVGHVEIAEGRAGTRGIEQVDGGLGMSDSSSDEEVDEEEEDDPLRRIADRIGDGGNEDDEQVHEEDPLNSDDDQSDDEDMNTLFHADNVVMCQFEKVHRARSKWKFTLKDGIMHLQGKDYCFQKCSGEAEW